MVSTSILLINIILFSTTIYAQTYTTCTNQQNINACEQLNRSESIQCVDRRNSVDCLLLVENGSVSFTSVSAEEGFLASSLTSNLVVLGEFVDPSSAGVSDYETAILVRKELGNGFASLKGAKFCHPGIDKMQTSPLILKEFETEALNQNNGQTCTDGRITIENYLSSVNGFFGSSCRPGKWSVVNNTFDTELKQNYYKLMELCNDISYLENQHVPYVQSLNCLLGGRGDIALTTINAIQNSLQAYPDILTNFTLLCKNGTNVNVTEGCSWSRQPGYLLIGNKARVTNLPRELEVWFRNFLYNSTTVIELPIENTDLLDLSEKFVLILKELLFPSQSHLINVITNTSTLETFIKARRDIPTPDKAQFCKSSVSICTTTTNEEQKCKWLQQVALNYGMQPVIYCTPKADKTECLNALQRSAVDVTVINESMMYIANRKNLSIIAVGEEDRQYMNRSVLVVNSALIKSLEDLKGKRGCFSEYGDIAWLSFTDTIRKQFWSNPNEYATELSQFLNVSCMPGIQDKEGSTFLTNVYEHLCDICEPSYDSSIRVTCKPDSTNNFYGSEGALKCLENRGEFAVLTLQDNLILPNNTVIMCKNGTLANTNDTNIDDDCALSVTAKDVIVVRNSDSKNRDIELLLQEIDERFAAQTHTPFKVFDRFGTQQDLIFADHTIGLEIASGSTNKYIKAQVDMFTNIPGSKSTTNPPGDGDFAARIETNLFLYASVLVILAFRYF